MRISDWSSDVCSSDLDGAVPGGRPVDRRATPFRSGAGTSLHLVGLPLPPVLRQGLRLAAGSRLGDAAAAPATEVPAGRAGDPHLGAAVRPRAGRSGTGMKAGAAGSRPPQPAAPRQR